jgi:N,N-dimethylformamidase beta subunit-like protein
MRTCLLAFPFLLAALLTGSAPAADSPPRLLGLSVSNGGHPFSGDTRQLATVSPNGDGFRDRALVRFRLDRPATVRMQVVATAQARSPGRVVWGTAEQLSAGVHQLVWAPGRATPGRTYRIRFLVRGRTGARVYGFEGPGRPTSGLVVRVLGVDVGFLQPSFPRGGKATPVSIATDARTIRLQFLSYSAVSGPRDPKTGAVAVTPPVRLDWRGNRDAPHVVRVGKSGSWPGGLYLLRVWTADGRVGYAPLVLRPRTLGEHRVAVVLSTNTWQAYNFLDQNGDGWGDSWYVGGASPTVDLRRPFLDFGVPFRFRDWDLSFISWLNRTGKQVDVLTDDDLERVASGDALRRAYDLVVFPGHEEYVSGHAYDVVTRYRDLGGDLMFLSANNFFWKVTRAGQTIRRVAMWRTLGKPEAALVGVQWSASNYGTSLAPYVVQGAASSPWVFAGTGLRNGTSFGRYGIEIDARAPSSPPGTRLLARITNAIGIHDAEMTYYESGSGARVFAAGALNFAASMTDPAVSRLVDNVWSRLAR